MGEAWHNNHHAFPGSARIGLYPGQHDWGYVLIRMLERVGLVWSVVLPVWRELISDAPIAGQPQLMAQQVYVATTRLDHIIQI